MHGIHRSIILIGNIFCEMKTLNSVSHRRACAELTLTSLVIFNSVLRYSGGVNIFKNKFGHLRASGFANTLLTCRCTNRSAFEDFSLFILNE